MSVTITVRTEKWCENHGRERNQRKRKTAQATATTKGRRRACAMSAPNILTSSRLQQDGAQLLDLMDRFNSGKKKGTQTQAFWSGSLWVGWGSST